MTRKGRNRLVHLEGGSRKDEPQGRHPAYKGVKELCTSLSQQQQGIPYRSRAKEVNHEEEKKEAGYGRTQDNRRSPRWPDPTVVLSGAGRKIVD